MLLGAYGWMHDSWNDTFYPEELPQEWQLSYYSNEFSAVLVPASVWSEEFRSTSETRLSCEDWLDSVSDEFHFYIECRADMFTTLSLQTFTEDLQTLQPQLAGLVVLDEEVSVASMEVIIDLADKLETPVFSRQAVRKADLKDRQVKYFQNKRDSLSRFALLENDLLDLRVVRKIVEDFTERSGISRNELAPDFEQAVIIANHPALSANDLLKFRSVLEIMGL